MSSTKSQNRGTRADGAKYISDTIPDGELISAGSRFHQTWRIRNTGQTVWEPGYTLSHIDGASMGAPEAVPLPIAHPGEEVSVAVTFAAPPNVGRYRSTWQQRNAAGAFFGDAIWAEIEVPPYVVDSGYNDPYAELIAQNIGIDANAPIDPQTGIISPQVADPNIIADIGTGWVRLNFILGQQWTSPNDPRRLYEWWGTWAKTYGHIIDSFRRKGLRIYAQIGAEAVYEALNNELRLPPTGDAQSHQWIEIYVHNFITILRMFRDDIEVVESFNEPDDWHGANGNWIHPEWFAIILQQLYERVKHDPEINHIKVVSGPLQGLSHNGNAAADYLDRTYAAGQARFGWGTERPFPFTGVGYHIYVEEGFTTNRTVQDEAIRRTYSNYIGQMQAVIERYENKAKPIYISEMGWFSNGEDLDLHEEFQASNIITALDLLFNDPEISPNVAFVSLFCTQDFGGDLSNKYYGLYRKGSLTIADRKPAYAAFQSACKQSLSTGLEAFSFGGHDDAHFVRDRIVDGAYMAAGEPFYNTWTVRNSGSSTWTEDYQLVFIGGDALDAPPSVYLSSCAPGDEISISVNFRATQVVGPVESYWRLANAQGQLFGHQLWVKINVFQDDV